MRITAILLLTLAWLLLVGGTAHAESALRLALLPGHFFQMENGRSAMLSGKTPLCVLEVRDANRKIIARFDPSANVTGFIVNPSEEVGNVSGSDCMIGLVYYDAAASPTIQKMGP